MVAERPDVARGYPAHSLKSQPPVVHNHQNSRKNRFEARVRAVPKATPATADIFANLKPSLGSIATPRKAQASSVKVNAQIDEEQKKRCCCDAVAPNREQPTGVSIPTLPRQKHQERCATQGDQQEQYRNDHLHKIHGSSDPQRYPPIFHFLPDVFCLDAIGKSVCGCLGASSIGVMITHSDVPKL
jgi:hypothetical protein